RQASRRELYARRIEFDRPVGQTLLKNLHDETGQKALESLWAWHALTGPFDELDLGNDEPYIRLWTVRLACDDNTISDELARTLSDLAYREPHIEVRSQLAASARRLPAAQALPILKNLAQRSQDVDDIHIPLLLWWAIESKAG